MIYIITPFLLDFRHTCVRFGIEVKFNFNGLPANGDVRWVKSLDALHGKRITEDDKVIYGDQFHTWPTMVQKHFIDEVAIRKADK